MDKVRFTLRNISIESQISTAWQIWYLLIFLVSTFEDYIYSFVILKRKNEMTHLQIVNI